MSRRRGLIGVLGRALPREVRERIYEPALDDLDWSRAHRDDGQPTLVDTFRQAMILAESLIYAVPAAVFVRGRFTLFGRLALLVLVIASLYVAYSLTAWLVYFPTPGGS